MRVVVVAVAVALALAACKKTEPAPAAVVDESRVDAAEQLRQRPQEVAHVTLKVLGMT